MAGDGFSDDPFGRWLAAMVAADKVLAERRAVQKAARRLELAPVRAEAARKGWETRRARETAEQNAEEAAWQADYARTGDGPWCDEMAHNSVGSEVFCIRQPGHDGDCEDIDGFAWTREEE
jgi:hypothetical protein